jgi:hypothetical protein
VARAIAALRLTPVLFELGARPHPPQDVYRAYLAQSDVFIWLYWQRYGQIGPGMETSGLEGEFELARGLPRLLYVEASAPGREPRLAGLLARIKEEALASYRTFRTPAELARLVRDDLAVLLSEPRLGLVAPRAAGLGWGAKVRGQVTAGSGGYPGESSAAWMAASRSGGTRNAGATRSRMRRAKAPAR